MSDRDDRHAPEGDEDGDEIDLSFPDGPDLDAFTVMAEDALARLPAEILSLCSDVVVRVANLPDDDTLDEMEIDDPLDLLGLFRGLGLAHEGVAPQTGQFPNEVWLYRLPILVFHEEGEDSLQAVIDHVLVHEIGHHFGLSDDDMYAIDDADD